jgi:hypothetical protein
VNPARRSTSAATRNIRLSEGRGHHLEADGQTLESSPRGTEIAGWPARLREWCRCRRGTWPVGRRPARPLRRQRWGWSGRRGRRPDRHKPGQSRRGSPPAPAAPARRRRRSSRRRGRRCRAGCGGSLRGRNLRPGSGPSTPRWCHRRPATRSGSRRIGPGWPRPRPGRSGSRRRGRSRTVGRETSSTSAPASASRSTMADTADSTSASYPHRPTRVTTPIP